MPGTQLSVCPMPQGTPEERKTFASLVFACMCTHREKLNLVYYGVMCICDLYGAFSVNMSHLQVEWTFHTWFWEKGKTIFDVRSVNFTLTLGYSKGMAKTPCYCQLPNSLWWIPLWGNHLPSKGSIFQLTSVLLAEIQVSKGKWLGGRILTGRRPTSSLVVSDKLSCLISNFQCLSFCLCVWRAWHSAVIQHQVKVPA